MLPNLDNIKDRIKELMRSSLSLLERGVMCIKIDDGNVDFGTLFVLDSQRLYKSNDSEFHVVSHRLSVKVSTE